jgi:uncharacterized RDD family membrane protein YckC
VATAPGRDPAPGPPPDRPGGPVEARVSAVPVEARPFQGARAGLVSRVAANTVDFGVVAGILGAGYLAVAAMRFLWNSRTFSFPTAPFGLLLLLGAAVTLVYLTGSWMTTGRTYGDHLFGLRVLSPWGRPLRIGGALLRALAYIVFPIGLFWVAVSRENRSIQDVFLRTSVIYDWA